MVNLDTPVLLLTYNRLAALPDQIRILKKLKAKKIYISSDGPKQHEKEDFQKVKHIRNYIEEKINWECEVYTNYSSSNMGCKKAVDSAIKWFFSTENQGIILEDDILPTTNFFCFMSEGLKHYADDGSISSICGRNDLSSFNSDSDIIFSSKFFCWGWASWSNRLKDIDLKNSRSDTEISRLLKDTTFFEYFHLKGIIGLLKHRLVSSWAYEYDLFFRQKKLYQVIPSKNMVINKGFDISGAHSKGQNQENCAVYHDFKPVIEEDLTISKNKDFINRYVLKKYRGVVRLILFSNTMLYQFIKKLIKS